MKPDCWRRHLKPPISQPTATNATLSQAPRFTRPPAPTSLDGTSVTIGGQPAFIDYISPTQVNALLASNTPTGTQQMVVTSPTGGTTQYSVMVNATEPGLLAPSAFKIGAVQYVVALFPTELTRCRRTRLRASAPGPPSRATRLRCMGWVSGQSPPQSLRASLCSRRIRSRYLCKSRSAEFPHPSHMTVSPRATRVSASSM